jgi:hypothetical protein
LNHHIIIIHGIGKARPGYSRPLTDGITAALKSGQHENASTSFIFHEVLWDDVVAFEQARLVDALNRGFGLTTINNTRNWFQRLIHFPKYLINTLRTDIAAQYIEDILSYNARSNAYPLIHERVSAALRKVAEDTAPADLSIIAHSLGTVIASDHIYDCQSQGRRLAGQVNFKNFFTLGSPIALFALKYGGAEIFTSPARLEDPSGVWLNIFDKDDPIGYPLKNLNDSYNQAVTEEVWVNTGWFGIAHTKYFQNPSVHQLIAGRL